VKSSDVVGATQVGRSIAILQDTCDSTAALAACQKCDVLIHEATYDKSLCEKAVEHGHSTAEMAGAFARACAARMLVLTHVSTRYKNDYEVPGDVTLHDLAEEARTICDPIPVVAARDFLSLVFSKRGVTVMDPPKSNVDATAQDSESTATESTKREKQQPSTDTPRNAKKTSKKAE